MAFRRAVALAAIFAAIFSITPPIPTALSGETSSPSGEADSAKEKAAFESAKELGTADAWNAFLNTYSTGFHADLARAYLKKLGEQQAGTPQLAPSSARAAEKSCSERKELRSEHSKEPTKITFVNKSGMYRALLWINFEGKTQDYGGVNSGDQVTLDTYRTHPWMIATGPGDCLQIFMPAAEPAMVELLHLAADDAPAPTKTRPKEPEKKVEKKKPIVCAKNWKLQNGRCVLQQNCGKNAYRSEEGDCYCNKGYQMTNGTCVWPHDKNGFEIAPEKKPGCKGLQQACNQGNGKACIKYEETCQVN